ncbi:hypothetical protein [Streptomyces sp. NBC_00328]|uniref:hypothetical protein n=1 Tax=Streptomyces sp. NBC_00328 TaxID=2903646 RepID=UPI002E2A29C4|nr:hypothetical protein [Streptomyces sp. NBC_00328]
MPKPYPEEFRKDVVPGPSLTLFIKERSRGPGYVVDFLYKAADLPVTAHGILANQGSGLGVIELELWRPGWGYWDGFGDFVGPPENDEDAPDQDERPAVLVPITGDMLRRIPVGQILARAQAELADQSWRDEGVILGEAPGRRPIGWECRDGCRNRSRLDITSLASLPVVGLVLRPHRATTLRGP